MNSRWKAAFIVATGFIAAGILIMLVTLYLSGWDPSMMFISIGPDGVHTGPEVLDRVSFPDAPAAPEAPPAPDAPAAP